MSFNFNFFKDRIGLNLNISVMARAIPGETGTVSGYGRQGKEGKNDPLQIFTILVCPIELFFCSIQKLEISSQFSNGQTDVSSTFMTEM